MAKPTPQQNRLGIITSLVVTGFGIGWLAGLSVSPVISGVITSVIGIAAAVVTALVGLQEEGGEGSSQTRRHMPKIKVWPLALLIFSIALGSITGILSRNNHLFGSEVTSEIKKWKDAGVPEEAIMARLFGNTTDYSPYTRPYTQTLQIEIERWTSMGIPKEQIVMRLFDQYFSTNQQSVVAANSLLKTDNRTGSLLFATASEEECDTWKTLIDKERYADLATEVKLSVIKPFRELPTIVTDTVQLAAIVGKVLCADTQ